MPARSLPRSTRYWNRQRPMRLAGKKALITGAGSGVGQGVAERFAREGADLAMLDLNQKGLDETAQRIAGTNRRIVLLKTDLGDTASARAAVERAGNDLNGLDILVNCAGIAVVKSFLEVTEEEYDAVQRTNIRGMYFISQAVARHMVRQKTGGRIVH